MIPYASPRDHFEDHLQRVHLLLTGHLVRHWHRVVDTSGKLNDLIVGLPEVWRMSTDAPGGEVPFAGVPTGPVIEARLAAHRESLIERARQADRAGLWLPIEALRQRAALTPDQLDLIIALAALQTDLGLHRLATFAWADFAIKHPTVGFLAELIATDRDRRLDLRACATPGHRLRRLHLIECFDSPLWGLRTPTLFQGVRLPERLLTWLLSDTAPEGLPPCDPDDLDLFCALVPTSPEATPDLEDSLEEALGEARQNPVQAVVIEAPWAPERASRIRACLDRPLLSIHPQGRAPLGDFALGLREAALQDAVPMICLSGEDTPPLGRLLPLCQGPVFIWTPRRVELRSALGFEPPTLSPSAHSTW